MAWTGKGLEKKSAVYSDWSVFSFMPMYLLLFLIIILDQVTKYLVQAHMCIGHSWPIIPGIFHFTYILNPGAAFGILKYQSGLFVMIAGALLIGIFYFRRRLSGQPVLMQWSVYLLAGGALGNMIDRIRLGFVVDFFDFRIWPIFNVADIAIVAGVIGVVYSLLQAERRAEKHE